ncbi:uncharacterized protein VTP21DRAFT_9223 [Calcarisporiella thermophila]|uniref:uncharacterized protein n=1 Tax=Calcarisporiella thermophila TaxID=911321 RepID=UPI003743DA71
MNMPRVESPDLHTPLSRKRAYSFSGGKGCDRAKRLQLSSHLVHPRYDPPGITVNLVHPQSCNLPIEAPPSPTALSPTALPDSTTLPTHVYSEVDDVIMYDKPPTPTPESDLEDAGELREAAPKNTSSAGLKESGTRIFLMGYRGDCEKCRLRVPGHYSHIIRK